jgi:regulator of protease activity HflC (stomatin/prohibitin superfamily)
MESKFRSTVEKKKMARTDQHIPPIAGALFGMFIIIAMLGVVVGDGRYADWMLGLWVAAWTMAGITILFALKVASQWEKVVVLRLGKFTGLRGPGLFWIIPMIDNAVMWIDHRVMVTSFSAEKTLTKDTVPVDVDAVLFWMVWDAEKAALEVRDYRPCQDGC